MFDIRASDLQIEADPASEVLTDGPVDDLPNPGCTIRELSCRSVHSRRSLFDNIELRSAD